MSHVAQHQTEDRQSDEKGARIEDEKQTSAGVHMVEALPNGSVDPVYAAKAQALNAAIQSIGMGRYQVGLRFLCGARLASIISCYHFILVGLTTSFSQWHLFIVVGFGYFVDNLYPVVTGVSPHSHQMLHS